MNATPDRDGRYPIHYQALEGRVVELERSLQAGVDADVTDSAGFTPLHFAAQSLHPEAVRLLIGAGAELEARNRFGATPLLVALGNARDDDHGVVGLLLDAGADMDAANSAGVSPRSLAERVSNFDLKRYLRLSGRA
jgi:ankyrin repeat protein